MCYPWTASSTPAHSPALAGAALNTEDTSSPARPRDAFRWRGRTSEHCFASGLDDYPRGEVLVDGDRERHVDLHAWLVAATQVLADVALHIGPQRLFLKEANCKAQLEQEGGFAASFFSLPHPPPLPAYPRSPPLVHAGDADGAAVLAARAASLRRDLLLNHWDAAHRRFADRSYLTRAALEAVTGPATAASPANTPAIPAAIIARAALADMHAAGETARYGWVSTEGLPASRPR